MPRWYEDAPTITLYHGTSTALLPAIQRDGLQPPRDLEDLTVSLAHEIAPRIHLTSKVKSRLLQSVLGCRQDSPHDPRGSAIYCLLDAENAAGYAHSYCTHGGEIAYSVYVHLKSRVGHAIQPRFPNARPVTLTLEVPRDWIITHGDYRGIRERCIEIWKRRHQDKPLGEFLDGLMNTTEVRVARPIPASMIVETT